MLGSLLQELRELLEAATRGTLGHFRAHAGPGDVSNPRWRRFSKLGRKHSAQHALGHTAHKGDVHDIAGGRHVHKVKAVKTGHAYSGRRVPILKLRKGARRHMAARARLAQMKWKSRSKAKPWLAKKPKKSKTAFKPATMKKKVA